MNRVFAQVVDNSLNKIYDDRSHKHTWEVNFENVSFIKNIQTYACTSSKSLNINSIWSFVNRVRSQYICNSVLNRYFNLEWNPIGC